MLLNICFFFYNALRYDTNDQLYVYVCLFFAMKYLRFFYYGLRQETNGKLQHVYKQKNTFSFSSSSPLLSPGKGSDIPDSACASWREQCLLGHGGNTGLPADGHSCVTSPLAELHLQDRTHAQP